MCVLCEQKVGTADLLLHHISQNHGITLWRQTHQGDELKGVTEEVEVEEEEMVEEVEEEDDEEEEEEDGVTSVSFSCAVTSDTSLGPAGT